MAPIVAMQSTCEWRFGLLKVTVEAINLADAKAFVNKLVDGDWAKDLCWANKNALDMVSSSKGGASERTMSGEALSTFGTQLGLMLQATAGLHHDVLDF